jgi:hypothetical protein
LKQKNNIVKDRSARKINKKKNKKYTQPAYSSSSLSYFILLKRKTQKRRKTGK